MFRSLIRAVPTCVRLRNNFPILKERLSFVTQRHYSDSRRVNDDEKRVSKEREEFLKVFPILCNDVASQITAYKMPPHVVNWVNNLLKESVPEGKQFRAWMVVQFYKFLTKDDKSITERNIFNAHVIGWCTEILHAFSLVIDDIMDESPIRRGKPSRYCQLNPMTLGNETIGMIALNDGILLESIVYQVLAKYLRSEKCYVDLLELFHEITFMTEVGQLMDVTQGATGDFTMENFEILNEMKTTHYALFLPIRAALVLANRPVQPLSDVTKLFFNSLMSFLSVQDDFVNCYGDESKTKKTIGNDIQQNKCTWLIVQALIHANPEQKELLRKHYGKNNSDDVAIVKRIYDEIGLVQIYKEYTEKKYRELVDEMKNVTEIPQEILLVLLDLSSRFK